MNLIYRIWLKIQAIRLYGVSKLNEKNSSVFIENSEEKLGLGSGVILSSNGYILSNFETTGGEGEECFVTVKSGKVYPANVVWSDSNLDISVIKISAENLLYLQMGDSNTLELGNKLYMLSNSTGYDLNETLSEVFISKNRTTFKILEDDNITFVEDVVILNSKIDEINKGGAVLNENGEILGIASSKINCVIPINRIKNILKMLQENENYKSPYLGIYGFDNNVLKYLIPEYSLGLGIIVQKVDEKGSANNKILEGDIITHIDDYELSSFQELSEYIYLKLPKEKINLKVIRGSKELNIDILLNEHPRPV